MDKTISFIPISKKFFGLNEIIHKAAAYSWRGIHVMDQFQESGLKDLIEKSLPFIDTPMVALIGSDILLLEDFIEKFKKIIQKYGYDIFMAGSRFNIRLTYNADNSEGYKKVFMEPRLASDNIDMVITSKFIWRRLLKDMPDFMVDDPHWVNWLCTYVDINDLKRFNCTDSLISLHCTHPDSTREYEIWEPGLNPVTIKNWASIQV